MLESLTHDGPTNVRHLTLPEVRQRDDMRFDPRTDLRPDDWKKLEDKAKYPNELSPSYKISGAASMAMLGKPVAVSDAVWATAIEHDLEPARNTMQDEEEERHFFFNLAADMALLGRPPALWAHEDQILQEMFIDYHAKRDWPRVLDCVYWSDVLRSTWRPSKIVMNDITLMLKEKIDAIERPGLLRNSFTVLGVRLRILGKYVPLPRPVWDCLHRELRSAIDEDAIICALELAGQMSVLAADQVELTKEGLRVIHPKSEPILSPTAPQPAVRQFLLSL